MGIFRDYPLQNRSSKQPIKNFWRYEIIPSILSNTLEVNKDLRELGSIE
jgi:hypothetical protein